MWFHAPFRADQWMLLDMRSVKLAGGRGTNIGYIYNSKGELAITVAQECLIRLREKPKE
jgi:acyl-CoA thioesterase II